MANWAVLKAAVANIIKTNGNQQITGQLLQNTLNNIISSVGENATFVGVATPSTTNPGTPDGKVFYLAGEGVYSNFNGITVEAGMLAIFYNSSKGWLVSTIDLGGAGGSAIILTWQTTFAKTVLQVKYKYRKPGLIITYKDTEGKWIILQYAGADVYSDSTYTDKKYWQNLLTTDDYNTLLSMIEAHKRVLNDSMALETIDTIRPQSNDYPYPFDKFEQNRAYRTYQASQVTDTKNLKSGSHDVDNATLIMRARSNKGNSFKCIFQVVSTEYNEVQITSEWTTYAVSSKSIETVKQVQINPNDDIDIMAVYLTDEIIDISEIDNENIERIAIDRYNAAKNKIFDTLNLYKYNIAMNGNGKWNGRGQVSSNLFKMPDILTIIHKPVIIGGAQQVLCFDTDKQFISSKAIKIYPYQNVKKEELPDDTEYISIVTNNFPISGNVEDMFVCEGYFPFIEAKGAYNYKEDEQIIKSLAPIGKNVLTDIQKNSTHPQSITGYDYLISIGSNTKDTTALMPADGEVISISGLKGNVTAAIVYFYNSDLTKIISNTSLVASDGEYKGTVTVPSGAAMFAVEIGHANGTGIDYSEFQIEFGDKITAYEKPVFGIKEICNYPIASSSKNNASNSALSLNIGTVFIFGDSITATNNQSSLEGDPDEYPNNVVRISWVPDTMLRLGVTKWYNFALGGAVWTDINDPSSFSRMSTQVNKAVSFSRDKDVVPDLVIVAMGANNSYNGDAEADYDAVMHTEEDAAYGYEGIPYAELDKKQLPQAIRWNLHTLEEKFPNAVKLLLTPPQHANRDYITDKGNNQKIKLIELFANAYCFEVIPQHKEAGIVRQFETTGKVEEQWIGGRDLVDQVHPNANGKYKIVRYLANKIASRYLI